MKQKYFWSDESIEFLKVNYPEKGLKYCAENLNFPDSAIRVKAAKLKLRLNKDSLFFKEWQSRAAKSKVGKKRPEHSKLMKSKFLESTHPLIEYVKNNGNVISEQRKNWFKNNEHPKGALGLKHTDETKLKCSIKAKQMWENMSEEKKDEYAKRFSILGSKQTMNRANASWKSGWREIGGIKKYYRSRWEANYARYLEWMKGLNQIKSWEHEPKTFWFDGIKRGCMSYLPDFRVIDIHGKESYHEVKGWMDDRSKTKIKRMAKYYPEVDLIVIDTKFYKSIEKTASKFIDDWE